MAFLEGFVDSFDFTRPGIDQTLGRDVKGLAAQRIYDRAITTKGGVSGPWPENEPVYAAAKEKRYDTDPQDPNVRTGQMLSQQSIEGRSTVEPKQVTMVYGTNTLPNGLRDGGALPLKTRGPNKGQPIDDKTDVEKAYFAHTGQSMHKIKRPFYEVNESDAEAVVELCQENLNDLIREKNAENGY
jgi:hypothetical protein